jgi:hypothetical protein
MSSLAGALEDPTLIQNAVGAAGTDEAEMHSDSLAMEAPAESEPEGQDDGMEDLFGEDDDVEAVSHERDEEYGTIQSYVLRL